MVQALEAATDAPGIKQDGRAWERFTSVLINDAGTCNALINHRSFSLRQSSAGMCRLWWGGAQKSVRQMTDISVQQLHFENKGSVESHLLIITFDLRSGHSRSICKVCSRTLSSAVFLELHVFIMYVSKEL